MTMQISSTQGRGGGSLASNRADRKDHVSQEIAREVSKDQAIGFLENIGSSGRSKSGYLRLDGAGGGGPLRFTDRWNVWPWRSAKGEVTGAAIKALFQKAGFPTRELDSFLAINANRQITHRQLSGLISSAQELKELEERLPAIKNQLDDRKKMLKEEVETLKALPVGAPDRLAQEDDLKGRIEQYRVDLSQWRSQWSNLRARQTQERIGSKPEAAQAELKTFLDMYRTIQFRGVQVGGAARPWRGYLKTVKVNGTDERRETAEVCALLHTAGYRTILSVDSSKETNQMHAEVPSGLRFQRFFKWAPLAGSDLAAELDSPLEPTDYDDGSAYAVRDFAAPTLKALMDVVELVAEASQEGEPVFIHCGGGAGRTGTFLAALMIVDRLSQARRQDPKFDPRSEPKVEFVLEKGAQSETKGLAYPFVANIIEELRQQDNSSMGYPSVETEGQLEVLNQLLERLIASQTA